MWATLAFLVMQRLSLCCLVHEIAGCNDDHRCEFYDLWNSSMAEHHTAARKKVWVPLYALSNTKCEPSTSDFAAGRWPIAQALHMWAGKAANFTTYAYGLYMLLGVECCWLHASGLLWCLALCVVCFKTESNDIVMHHPYHLLTLKHQSMSLQCRNQVCGRA